MDIQFTETEAKHMIPFFEDRIKKIDANPDLLAIEKTNYKNVYWNIIYKTIQLSANPAVFKEYLEEYNELMKKTLHPTNSEPEKQPITSPRVEAKEEASKKVYLDHLTIEEFRMQILPKLPAEFEFAQIVESYCEYTHFSKGSAVTSAIRERVNELLTKQILVIKHKGAKGCSLDKTRYGKKGMAHSTAIIVTDADTKRYAEINKALVPDAITQRRA
jgi:hypothetical protein